MKIALGADHRGGEIMVELREFLQSQGHEVMFFGPVDEKPCDYPDTAYQVGSAVSKGQTERGILVCGSGIGMSIAANKVAAVRAALVHDEVGAEMSRRHNDANVLCLAADMLGKRIIERIVEVWLSTEFEGGRHARRVAKVKLIEAGQDPTEASVEAAETA